MKYKSTRSTDKKTYTGAEVILHGLAPDGGLFMPVSIPALSPEDLKRLSALSYPELAADIIGRYLDDYSSAELLEYARAAYDEDKFPECATKLRMITPGVFSLELWHGPTCAFKDMALQMMPRLMSGALKKTREKKTALILVATSGDTGKAALEGFKSVDGIKIQVFYPADGVSETQRLQMITQDGNNVSVCGIKGNFDDAQTAVKNIFSDRSFAKKLASEGAFLSSANSINWGRLVPQIVYYVSAYCSLLRNGAIYNGEKVDICVPTGNFGNILAAYIAKKMGVPFGRFVCASNENNVLTDFFATGVYDKNRVFHTTMSPSMDILVSSNLERLLYLICGAEKTAVYMQMLKECGRYELTASEFEAISKEFVGYYTNDEDTASTISKVYNNYGYLIDTHTAVAMDAANRAVSDGKAAQRTVVASTASPFKFSGNVLRAIGGSCSEGEDAQALLSAETGCPLPAPLSGLAQRYVRFPEVIEVSDMQAAVLNFCKD